MSAEKLSPTESGIYSGLAFVGRAKMVIVAVLVGITALIMIGVGISIAVHKAKRTASTSGEITNAGSCAAKAKDSHIFYNCSGIAIQYMASDKKYQKRGLAMTQDSKPVVGDTMQVYYDPDHPDNYSLTKEASRASGYMMIFLAIVLMLVVGGIAYAVFKYKAAAGIMGVDALTSGFRS